MHVFITLCLLSLDVDDCVRQDWSCENGGQAVDTGNSCECECAAGYTGEHCQTGQFSKNKRGLKFTRQSYCYVPVDLTLTTPPWKMTLVWCC